MLDATPVRRPRRWWRVVRVVILLLGVVLAVTFTWAPTIGARYAAGHLPWTTTFSHGSLTVVAVNTTAATPLSSPSLVNAPLDVQVVGSTRILRSLASSVSNWWLPAGLVRGGQNVSGQLSLPILREKSFTWQVLVAGDAATPLACVHVSHVDLTQFLRTNGQTVLMLGGAPVMRCSYHVDWGHIEDDDEIGQAPLIRRFKVVARGSILLVIGQSQRLITVDRLAGHAWLTFVPVLDGYRLQMRVSIEDVEAELITLPLVGDARPMLMKQLEAAANEGLIDGLEKVVLPSWFPTDLRTDILVN